MTLTLRPTTIDELPFVHAAERADHARDFVLPWAPDRHAAAIADPGQEHLLVESDGVPTGFVLTAGVGGSDRSVELRRVVVTRPGLGLGLLTVELALGRAFDEQQAHRVWLDVKTHNARARHVYATVGFVEEGTLRDAVRNGDRYESLVVMSMLRPEWVARRVG